MSRTKITTVGQLIRMENGALFYSVFISETGQTAWLEALTDTEHWPGLEPVPQEPKYDPPRYKRAGTPEYSEWSAKYKAAKEQWQQASDAYNQALHSDASYNEAASDFTKEQQNQPTVLQTASQYFWKHVWLRAMGRQPPKGCTSFLSYRDKILRVESTDPEIFFVNGNQFFITGNGVALVKQAEKSIIKKCNEK